MSRAERAPRSMAFIATQKLKVEGVLEVHEKGKKEHKNRRGRDNRIFILKKIDRGSPQ